MISEAADFRQEKITEIARDGLVPGSLEDEQGLYGRTRGRGAKVTTSEQLEVAKTFSKDLAKHFQARGRAILSEDPASLRAFNKGAKLMAGWSNRELAASAAIKKSKKMGIDAIPVDEREARKAAFVDEVLDKAKLGEKDSKNKYKPRVQSLLGTPGQTSNLSVAEKRRLKAMAGNYFDAWGPAAEATVKRVDSIYLARENDRVHYSDRGRYFAFHDSRSFFHEFSHGIERHTAAPRDLSLGGRALANATPKPRESFWSNRVQSRDESPAEWLGRPYGRNEVAKKDKWGDSYMGKVYNRGTTEVVSMLSEAHGGNEERWRQQLLIDPSVVLEFMGYMEAVIKGEVKRQAGIPGRVI